jgi:hypothetical protein
MWRVAFALAVLVVAVAAAVEGTRSHQIYAVPGAGRADAKPAASPAHR